MGRTAEAAKCVVHLGRSYPREDPSCSGPVPTAKTTLNPAHVRPERRALQNEPRLDDTITPLGLLPWHRSDRFPQFPRRARIRLAPPLRRSPSAPYPGVRRTDPSGSRSLWFLRQVSGSRRFNRGSGVFACLIPTGPRWTSDCDTNAHHRRLFTAAAWRGLEPAPGSGLRRTFLHLSCSLCTIGQFIANLPFLRLRRTLDAPAQAVVARTPWRRTIGHSVCLAAGVSGGLKSHSVRGPGPISEGGGNASSARVDGRYGEASEARRRKPGHG